MKTNHAPTKPPYEAATLLPIFCKLLPCSYIQQLVDKSEKQFYQRIFTPLVLLWCLIYQRLNADHTQDEVLVHVTSGAADHLSPDAKRPISQRIKSESTAAYSKGQQRFPLSVLTEAVRHTAQASQQTVSRWQGHPLALLDGTIFRARPTKALRQHYGVLHNQHGEHYWIQIRGVGVFCLYSGAVLTFTEAPVRTSEQKCAFELMGQLDANTVLLGDRNFGIFAMAQAARHHQQHPLFRLTGARARKVAGRFLRAGDDVSVNWSPSRQDQVNAEMSTAPIPGRVVCYRVERKGFRPRKIFLFTTLQEPTVYTVEALGELYGLRGHVELNLRYVKEQLELGELKGKSPDSVRKELYSGLLTYNLIRASMAEAAAVKEKLSPLTLSFTRCWRRLRLELIKLRATDTPEHLAEVLRRLLLRLRQCKLPQRKVLRLEPRAVRTRPRTYPYLVGDRKKARKKYRQKLNAQIAKS